MANKAFPFELVLKDKNEKELFINTVEKLLMEDLQNDHSFGCKISRCHTHVGSKKHFTEFIEAELLFHNSYYNKGFAYLTIELISEIIHGWNKIMLIGYETFSELYLCETSELLKQRYKKEISYCVVETIGDEVTVREQNPGFYDDRTYCVFIVPINTTLTTHDKLMCEFYKHLKKLGNINCNVSNRSINIGLIMLSPKTNNDYWERIPGEGRVVRVIKSKQHIFKQLQSRKVYYFAEADMSWRDASECSACFPDLKGSPLARELPMFEVNRASIVPMLQLGPRCIPEPLDESKKRIEEVNIKKVIELSENLYHHHILRNGNHYQYYFNTQTFFETKKNSVDELSLKTWLETNVKKKLIKQVYKSGQNDDGYVVYNFLVAPRHHSNAGFVKCVNDVVFDGSARILYFEVGREYRDNVKAKYSDFSSLVTNISENGQKSVINFHYVDDMIFSGGTFSRAKSLINSLIDSGAEESYICQKNLFASIILLVGRSSNGTKQNMIENIENYFEYVHLTISPMRNHKDACTLCQLVNNFKKLKDISATNQMASYCEATINSHKELNIDKIGESEKSTAEKKIRVIIRHLLNERLKNNWWMDLKKDSTVVKIEDEDSIYAMLDRFYHYLPRELKKYGHFDTKDIYVAFIKVITRPFFTYHIRKRQAALRFCIELTEKFLNKTSLIPTEYTILRALVNGLSDMNAIYLIRAQTMDKVFQKIKKEGITNGIYYKAVKKLVGLSMDDSIGILLEYILVQKHEQGFLGDGNGSALNYVKDDDRRALYLENNKILLLGFKNICNQNSDYTGGDLPYYLEKFGEIFKINNSAPDKYIDKYRSLNAALEKDEVDLGNIACKVRELFPDRDVEMFFRNKDKTLLLNKYLWVAPDNTSVEKKYTIIGKFYMQNNLEEIDTILNEESILDTLYIGDSMFIVKIVDGEEEEIFFKLKKKNITKPSDESMLFFEVKILLTLRKRIIDVMKKINIFNVKRHLEIERAKKALSIEKAGTHHIVESFEGQIKLTKMYKELEGLGAFQNEKEFSTGKILFDNYLQLIANNFVSETYRHIVAANCIKVKKYSLDGIMEPFLKKIGFKEENGMLSYTIQVPNDTGFDVKVKIVCDCNSFKEKYFWHLLRGLMRIKAYYLLILTMAGNAGRHYMGDPEENICQMNVYAEDEYMVFSNDLSDKILSKDKIRSIKEAAEMKMNCPPWEFEATEQSITLWTLNHYFERIKELPGIKQTFRKDKEWILLNVNDRKFEIKLRLLK